MCNQRQYQPLVILCVLVLVLTACGGPASSPTSLVTPPPAATVAPVTAVSATQQNTSASPPSIPAVTGGPTGSIRIGVAATQSGGLSITGQDQVSGIYIAQKYFNDHGGVNGHPVVFSLEDAGSDETSAVMTFRAFATGGQVVGIIGPTLSQQAFAADPIANKAKIPVIGASNTAQGIAQIGPYITRVSAPGSATAPAALKSALARAPTIRRVALFYARNDSSAVSEADVFQHTAESLKLTVTTVQKYQTTDRDFHTQITTVLETRPDLVIISGLAVDGGTLVRQLRMSGFKDTIIGGDGLNNTALYAACGAMCDGLLVTEAYNPAIETETNRALRTAYRTQFNKDPPVIVAQAFTSVQVFVEALRLVDAKTRVETLSLDSLRDALNTQIQSGTYVTPLGEISFDNQHELVQHTFVTALIHMNADGSFGSLEYLP